MKNKNAHMITFFEKNEDLVFIAYCFNKWRVVSNPVWDDNVDCFLCLPKHKEALLNFLNGGVSGFEWNGIYIDTDGIEQPKVWYSSDWYMEEDCESSVIERNKTRYAYVDENGYIGQSYETKAELLHSAVGHYDESRVIEFEMEV